MEPLMDVLKDYLDTAGVQYMEIEGRPDLRMGYALDSVNVQCSFKVNEEARFVTFQCFSGIKAPPNRRGEVAEFIARANYGLSFGCWQYDMDDGEIYYQTSVCARGVDVPSSLMAPLLYAALDIYDRYYSGLVDVIYIGVPPEDAIEAIEGASVAGDERAMPDPVEVDEVVRLLLEEDKPAEPIAESVDGLDACPEEDEATLPFDADAGTQPPAPSVNRKREGRG
jgi:hypothetical protein